MPPQVDRALAGPSCGTVRRGRPGRDHRSTGASADGPV